MDEENKYSHKSHMISYVNTVSQLLVFGEVLTLARTYSSLKFCLRETTNKNVRKDKIVYTHTAILVNGLTM